MIALVIGLVIAVVFVINVVQAGMVIGGEANDPRAQLVVGIGIVLTFLTFVPGFVLLVFGLLPGVSMLPGFKLVVIGIVIGVVTVGGPWALEEEVKNERLYGIGLCAVAISEIALVLFVFFNFSMVFNWLTAGMSGG